jgi:PmbA protein
VPGAALLARAVRDALAYVRAQPGVREAEVFAADNRTLLTRLNYTSHIPCNGVEEPKSAETHGIGVQVAIDSPDGVLLGFGSEPSDLSTAGVARALDKARRGAVRDPEFRSLPKPGTARRELADYHDPALLEIGDAQLVETGWTVLQGGLRAFLASSRLAELAGSEAGLRRLGLILGGDVTILQESMAIASTAMPEPQSDVSTLLTSFATGMVEGKDAKGSGWSTGTRLGDLTGEAGAEAAQRAIEAIGGERVPSGDYTVIFGRQPVADLMNNLVVPSCQAGAFYSSSTPFLGKLGKTVASPRLSVYDHGALPGLMGSKGITCEGLPTGRTDLIKNGMLAGVLTDWYDAQRLLADPAIKNKLGVAAPEAAAALAARNGFRHTGSGGRAFDTRPGTSASNIVVEGADPVSLDALIRSVRDGLYIGRIWYTYPINGLRAGDFTCTVVGDSFIIRDGRFAAPLKANTVRINDNITRVLASIAGVGTDSRGTVVWAADEVVYTPEVAVTGVHVDAIAGFMEALGS